VSRRRRAQDGILCALSNGSTAFGSATLWSDSFTNAAGLDAPEYWSTIQFPDVNADGNADVCGRHSSGIVCALSNGASAFGPLITATTEYNDASPFDWSADPSNYRTIQFGWADRGDCDYANASYALPWRTSALPPRN